MNGRSIVRSGALLCLASAAWPTAAAAQAGPQVLTPGTARFEIVAGGAVAPLRPVEIVTAKAPAAPQPVAKAPAAAPPPAIVAEAPPAKAAAEPAAETPVPAAAVEPPQADPVVTATMPPEQPQGPEVRPTDDDNVKLVRAGDALMAEAARRAQASLDDFIATAKSPPEGARGFAVKVALGPKDARENIWVSALERRVRRKVFVTVSESWSGRLSNAPVRLQGLKLGDRVSFGAGDIRDWTYRAADGRIMGNFSACAIAAGEGQEKLGQLVAALRLDCGWVEETRKAAAR